MGEVLMRVYVYPADQWGCGHVRMIWPAEALRAQGHDVTVVDPDNRGLFVIPTDDGRTVRDMTYPRDADVMVFQRVTHGLLAQAVPWLTAKGVAVIVDIDDDLAAIHPANPAWRLLHPKTETVTNHSWRHLTTACRHATMVTTSSDALAARYAPHGRFRVLRNRIPRAYLDTPHVDTDVIGWPASLHSHPDDPGAIGPAVARLTREGARFEVFGDPVGTGRAFGLEHDPTGPGNIPFRDWPLAVARLGIGIAPLVDTRFNAAKSHLKPLELAACGVPWVGSPRPEYLWLHALGTGIIADRSRDWYRALRALLDSPDRRQEMSAAGRKAVAGMTIENGAHLWWEAWADAVASTPKHKQPARPTRRRLDPKRPKPKQPAR